jgi:hypothetical protein
MGVCGKECRYCKKRVTGTWEGGQPTFTIEDPIERHTHKCAVDSAKNKVFLAFVEYLKLENGKELIDELREMIVS